MLTFQCYNFTSWVHDCRIGSDWPPDGIVGIIHVYDDNLRCLTNFLPDTNVSVWLHGKGAEPNISGIDAKACELTKQKRKYNAHFTLSVNSSLACVLQFNKTKYKVATDFVAIG